MTLGEGTFSKGVRSRMIHEVNGLDVHILEAGYESPAPTVALEHCPAFRSPPRQVRTARKGDRELATSDSLVLRSEIARTEDIGQR